MTTRWRRFSARLKRTSAWEMRIYEQIADACRNPTRDMGTEVKRLLAQAERAGPDSARSVVLDAHCRCENDEAFGLPSNPHEGTRHAAEWVLCPNHQWYVPAGMVDAPGYLATMAARRGYLGALRALLEAAGVDDVAIFAAALDAACDREIDLWMTPRDRPGVIAELLGRGVPPTPATLRALGRFHAEEVKTDAAIKVGNCRYHITYRGATDSVDHSRCPCERIPPTLARALARWRGSPELETAEAQLGARPMGRWRSLRDTLWAAAI